MGACGTDIAGGKARFASLDADSDDHRDAQLEKATDLGKVGPNMKRVFGIETEYGITVDGVAELDVVRESIALVRCYTEHGALMKWDYALEDPHQDARGFRAEELLQDTDEAAYYEIDKARALSFE